MEVVTDEFLKDDVDTDESENEEIKLEEEVITLENKIAENKFDYQPYLDLIKALKSLVDLDRLRDARKRMANQFPLSPDLWIDWLQDEISLATTPEEKEKVINLFQTAVKDYLSVEIWVQYTSYYIAFQNEKASLDFSLIRNIFEEALTAAGLHVTKGSSLWNNYIEFETSLLSHLKNEPEGYKNQLKRIANLYKRQLSCPLWNIEATFEKFEKWLQEAEKSCGETIIDREVVENIYKKSKDKLEKIKSFEEALVNNTENNLDIYKKYLEHEKSKEGSPVRVQCLYERLLCDKCLDEEMWLEYIQYVNTVLRNPDLVINICKRAVRNCPWCCRIYQALIKCLEKYEKPRQNITDVVEEAFASGLQTASDFRDIWMSYLEYLRRSFDSSANEEEEKKLLKDLRTAFTKAAEFVLQMNDADPEYTILQYWARIEAIYCKNMDKSRELWNIILADERNKTAEMWLEYIHLERTFGDSKHLRKLFPRALQGTKDQPEQVAKTWVNYERDEGTLESFENCSVKIAIKMKEVKERLEKESLVMEFEKPIEYVNKKYKKINHSKQSDKFYLDSKMETEKPKVLGYKRKNNDIEESSSPPKKNRQNNEESFQKEYQHPDNNDIVTKLLEESKKSHGETVIHESSKDNRTVFVSNLDFSTEEPLIREAFSSCGSITDLRLVRDYKGRSKGYCYVEFDSPSEVQNALKKDRELINGRPMFVSKCDPDKETRASGFKYSNSMEKNKLFIRGLPFSITVDDLKSLFSTYGALKDVRLVTYRNGHSKGLAYVDFEDETSAAQAVLSTDGTTIQGKQISVAISNPPERKTEGLGANKTIFSLGGGPKEIGARGRSRTQISFLPRSVTLSKSNATADSPASMSTDETKKMSNSDFRKLLR